MLGPVQSLARYLIIWQSLQQDVTSNPIFEAMPTWLEECSQQAGDRRRVKKDEGQENTSSRGTGRGRDF
jgi:hypothetical protein